MLNNLTVPSTGYSLLEDIVSEAPQNAADLHFLSSCFLKEAEQAFLPLLSSTPLLSLQLYMEMFCSMERKDGVVIWVGRMRSNILREHFYDPQRDPGDSIHPQEQNAVAIPKTLCSMVFPWSPQERCLLRRRCCQTIWPCGHLDSWLPDPGTIC